MCPTAEIQESISIALKEAQRLTDKIEFILTCNVSSLQKLNEQVGPDIQKFISSNQEFINFERVQTDLSENVSTFDLLLNEIIKQFCIIKKIIKSPNYKKTPAFFQNNPDKILKKSLLKIREELNKFNAELNQKNATQFLLPMFKG